jgi:hypothetical protein
MGDPPVGLVADGSGVWVTSSHKGVREIDPAFNSVRRVRAQAPNYLNGGDVDLPSPVAVGAGSIWVASRTLVTRFDPRTRRQVKWA